MPTYIVHGFRWPRPLIRIHIILQNLDDAAAEWLMAPMTTATLMQNFSALYPTIMPSLPTLRFIEQYDPLDERAESKSQPYAYVADYVSEVKLGVDLDEARSGGISNETWSSMVELRDKLAPGEKLSWFVVVCGDTERWAPPVEGEYEDTSVARGIVEVNGHGQTGAINGSGPRRHHRPGYANGGGSLGSITTNDKRSSADQGGFSSSSPSEKRPSTSRSLKKVFSFKNLRRTKSNKSLRSGNASIRTVSPPPPLPGPSPAANSRGQQHAPGTAV